MRRDAVWLLLFAVLATVSRLYVLSHTTAAARDSVQFVQIALNMGDLRPGVSFGDVLRHAQHPPGYPCMMLAAARILYVGLELSPDEWMRAGQVATVAVAFFLVVPVYFLGRQAFDRRVGLLAALFTAALPVLADVSSDVLTDGSFLVFVTASLALAQRGLVAPRWSWWLLAGIAAGVAYLIRPEGAVTALAAGLMLAGSALKKPRTARTPLVGALCLTLGFAMVAGPYVATIGKLTNKRTGGRMVGESVAIAGPTLFAAAEPPSASANLPKALRLTGMAVLRAGHYGIAILGVIGAFALRKNSAALLLLVQAALSLAMLVYLGTLAGYVAARHGLTIALIASVFAAALMLRSVKSNSLAVIVVVVLFAAGYPRAFKSLHPDRAGHRAAGLWVVENVPADAKFVDPYTWSEFFARRSYRGFPHQLGVVYRNPFTYALLETKPPSQDSYLPDREVAQRLAEKGEIVWRWPLDETQPMTLAIYKAPSER